MDLMQAFNNKYLKAEPPVAEVGDTVRVHVHIKEGNRERIQVFEGTVIAKKHGGIEETITVRRISYGVGVEKVFPVHSPSIDKIEVVRNGSCAAMPSCTICAAAWARAPRSRKAVIQDEREAKASLFSCHTKFPRHLVILTVL